MDKPDTTLDYKKVMEQYLDSSDWRSKESSTVTYSIGGLILSNAGALTANYWLSEIYDKEIGEAHKNGDMHLHDLSIFGPYCGGWNLKQLITEGLGGVEGRITSTPARHLSTLCNQMVNFLGILQNEWAGAQAFSSFDTYLAPFVKVDNLSYKQVKQCIQSFIYGVNTPSRWGCVPLSTEVLSTDGFKKYNELKEGDLICTWKDGELQLNPVRKVIRKPFKGKLHSYRTRNYDQTVTPNHRMLIRKHNSNECVIKRSEEIFDVKTPYALPVAFSGSAIQNDELNEDLITLAAMAYTDGSFLFENGKIKRVTIYKSPNRFGNDELRGVAEALGLEYTVEQSDGEYGVVNQYKFYGESARFIQELCGQKERIADKFLAMSKEQARLFLDVWASLDGDEEKQKCQYDNDIIRDQLQQIAILSGRCSYLVEKKLPSGKTTKYVKIRKVDSIYPTERVEVEYDGDVWCPNVENGTAVFRENGVVFISGQTQAPFTNITLDWTVPEDLADDKAIIGGEEMDFCYKDCQKEMDMVNKAFIEVFNEGDANGRGFQYPIPTYSITKDFNWEESENNKLLFEMAAKFGTPYFSNYINSDMKPSDVRSMAVLGTQNIIYRDKFGRVSKNEIRHLVEQWKKNPETQYSVLMNGQFVDIMEMYEIPYENYDTYVEIKLKNGQIQNFSYDHKFMVVRNGQKQEILAQDVKPGDKALLGKKVYSDSQIGTYEAGKIVGYYLAEGWTNHNDKEVDFAINEKREDICKEIQVFFEDNFGARVSIEHLSDKHIFRVKVYSAGACGFVRTFISGENAREKHIEARAYDTSAEFRRGIYDSYLETDGSKKNHIFAHTTNKNLCRDMIELFATIGKYFKYQVNTNNTRYFKPDKSDLEKFTSYKLYLYEPEAFDDDYFCVEVESVAERDAKRINKVYNFMVNTKEHLFELPNGVITPQCPLYSKEKVLVRDDFSREWHISEIGNLKEGKEYDILFNGEVKRAKINKFSGLEFYKVKTANNQEVIMSGNHLNLVYGGDVKETINLTTKDYLPFNIRQNEGDGLDYESGLMVGAYLGDGSLKDNYGVVYSLNTSSKVDLMAKIMEIAVKRFGAKVSTYPLGNNCVNVTIYSRMLRGLIEEYVTGKALTKTLDIKCVGKSVEFRRGILEGYQSTDGSKNKRIYSSSLEGLKSLTTMLASLGIPSRIDCDDRGSDTTYSDNPVYCLRYYSVEKSPSQWKDIFRKDQDFMWFRIAEIQKLENVGNVGYCFEVLDDEEPYFILPSGLVTHNCRLRLDLRELTRKNGGYFGSGESTGSVGVVTINLPRLGYLAEDEKDFYDRLDRLMDIAARSLDIKRKTITEFLEKGLYPYTKHYLGSFDNHFSTIGMVGLNEACLNAKWIREDISKPKAHKFAEDVLNHMRERLVKYQEKYKCLFNLEATPAESTAYRLAKHDVEKYPDIITAAPKGETPYYTNSSHLPVGFTEDVFTALDLQDPLQTLYTSGTVFHTFLGERLQDWKSAAMLIKKIAENYKLPYFTLSPTYSICKNHGYLSGEQPVCPVCYEKTEVWSRITGYYRPISNWNDGKVKEFEMRKEYKTNN